jgi:hypothetical protein
MVISYSFCQVGLWTLAFLIGIIRLAKKVIEGMRKGDSTRMTEKTHRSWNTLAPPNFGCLTPRDFLPQELAKSAPARSDWGPIAVLSSLFHDFVSLPAASSR